MKGGECRCPSQAGRPWFAGRCGALAARVRGPGPRSHLAPTLTLSHATRRACPLWCFAGASGTPVLEETEACAQLAGSPAGLPGAPGAQIFHEASVKTQRCVDGHSSELWQFPGLGVGGAGAGGDMPRGMCGDRGQTPHAGGPSSASEKLSCSRPRKEAVWPPWAQGRAAPADLGERAGTERRSGGQACRCGLAASVQDTRQGRPGRPCDDASVLVGPEATRGPAWRCRVSRLQLLQPPSGPPAPWDVRVVREPRVFARRLLPATGAFYCYR